MKQKHPKKALRYAKRVIAGSIPAGKLVKLACQRFIDDLSRDDLEFREVEATAACRFIETLPHIKGKWASKRELLILADWQVFIVCAIFGFYKDGLRRFVEVYIEVPRKNGKSTLAAAIALYMFCESREEGAEVYSGATTERQAWEVFRPLREMVKRSPALKGHYDITVAAKSLYIESVGARAEPLIGKPGDGASPILAVVDEYHEHVTDELYDTMRTGMGARDEPLMLVITTAGDNLSGPCHEKRDDVQRILEGQVEDDAIFGIIYCIDEGDDWDTIESVIKANPNYGVSVSKRFLEQQLQQARRSATKQNSYKTKHCNLWVGAKVAWMNMLAWQRQKQEIDYDSLAGCRAWLGLDLASKKDVAAICALVETPAGLVTFQRFFAPEGAENDKYLQYATDGHLELTPGNATDYTMIEDEIIALNKHLDCQEVGFDQWQAQYMAQRLLKGGIPMTEFPHQVRTFSDPMKEIESMTLDDKLNHDGNPAMTWMVGNVTASKDKKDNIYPNKARPNDERCKIDGLVALIMAMGLYLRAEEGGTLSDWLANPVAL